MNKSDITVGMTFYRIIPDRRGEDTNEMRGLTVVKVGNKYMEMSNGDNVSIETLIHVNKNYSQDSYTLHVRKSSLYGKKIGYGKRYVDSFNTELRVH